jgi:fermentation-respiration switch protein FrsA (DUF1100 family)
VSQVLATTLVVLDGGDHVTRVNRRHSATLVLTLIVGLASTLTMTSFVLAAPSGATTRVVHRRTKSRVVATHVAVRTAAAPPPPRPVVPFDVGVLHVTYTDTSRSTDARGDTPASESRVIPVTVRYPIAGAASDTETPDAPAEIGSFPLVVFAHGFDVSADTYATIEHQLASAGFVVAAPDFPLTSSALPGPAIESDVSNQAADVSFVITSILDASEVPAPLFGVIDPTEVGVVGHSDGGVTAAAVAYNSTVADPRIGAAVILSGAEARYDGSWFTTASPPLLAIHGTADEVNSFESSTTLFDDATGPKMLVGVDGGSHLGPFTTDPVEPEVATLAAEFLRDHLEGDTVAAGRLDTDANVDGELTLVAQG